MATEFDKTLQYIFPQAANKPPAAMGQPQAEKPWWAAGNTLSSRKAKKVGKRGRRRDVFYDPRVGPQPSSSGASDLELIREILTPRSSIVVNDPSGWLNGGAEREFQQYFNRTPEQEANYARRKKELEAGSMAAMNPQAGRQVVDVARQNQEAMDMIFPKAPQSSARPSSDVMSRQLPGGITQNTINGRYGTGSSTLTPATNEWSAWSIPSAGDFTEETTAPAQQAAQMPKPVQAPQIQQPALAMDIFGPPAPPAGPPKSLMNQAPTQNQRAPEDVFGAVQDWWNMLFNSPTAKKNINEQAQQYRSGERFMGL